MLMHVRSLFINYTLFLKKQDTLFLIITLRGYNEPIFKVLFTENSVCIHHKYLRFALNALPHYLVIFE